MYKLVKGKFVKTDEQPKKPEPEYGFNSFSTQEPDPEEDRPTPRRGRPKAED